MTNSYWHNARRSRRSVIAASGAALALAACGKSTKRAGTPSADGQPKRGGTFRYVQNIVTPMDPATGSPNPLTMVVYENLAVWKQTEQKAAPHLARSWEQPDAATIVFHLDTAAHWQDKAPLNGRKLTSQDWKYTFNYYNSPDPRFLYKSAFDALDLNRTETPDDGTVVLHLKQPVVSQLTTLLANSRVQAVPHETVERDGNLNKEAIGSGPFVVDTYVDNGPVHLVRNKNYWKPGLPYLDDVQTFFITDVAAQFSAFSSGNVDMLSQVSLDQVKDLPKSAQINITPTWLWYGLRFNLLRKPFDDVRVRRALHLAIDREAMNQILYAGHSEPSAAIVPSLGKFALPKTELLQQPGYRKPKDQDLADAKKLLEAAGVKDPSWTVIGNTTSVFARGMPVALVDQMAKIGVKLTPNITDFANYQRLRGAPDFDLSMDNSSGTGDPDTPLRDSFYTRGGKNYTKYSNPQLDALIDKQALEADSDKRAQLVYDIQRLLLTDLPVAHIGYHVTVTPIQPYLHGVTEWLGPVEQATGQAFGQTAWLDKK